MIAPNALIAELMQRVRLDLYRGRPDKQWYQQQDTVKKALTWPAAWLEQRKVPMSPERYRAILGGILDTMGANGKLTAVTYPGAYLLHVVQQHMEHHGDTYYQECKGARNRVTLEMAAVEKAVADRRSSPAADIIAPFAQVHAALAIGKSKGRPKAAAASLQPDLFARAKPRQKG
jgi:hypothetical protein